MNILNKNILDLCEEYMEQNLKNKNITLISMLLKAVVVVSAVAGTIMSAYAGRDSFMGGRAVFMYFTIQSNLVVAAISIAGAVLMLKKNTGGRIWQIVKLMGASAISLTCLVFCFVLAPTLGEYAWSLQNVLTHVIGPVCCVADFFVSENSQEYKREDSVWVTVLPLLYVAYAGIGYISGWHFSEETTYPYFFLNWGSKAGAFGFVNEMPYFGTVWWILVLTILMLLLGLGYVAGANAVYRKRNIKVEAKPVKKKNWFRFEQ